MFFPRDKILLNIFKLTEDTQYCKYIISLITMTIKGSPYTNALT